MSNFHKSKRFDPIDTFNNTSRYFDDKFTIVNLEFEEKCSWCIYIVYRTELLLNGAFNAVKETSFFDYNINVIGSNIHINVYDKRENIWFFIVNFHWLNGDIPRLL